MKRITVALCAALMICTAFAVCGFSVNAEEQHFTTKKIVANVYADRMENVECRFYDDMPNIPYVRLTDYYRMFNNSALSSRKTGDGKYIFTTPLGASAEIDTNADTITSDDYLEFINPNIRKQKIPAVMYDFSPFLKYKEVLHDKSPQRISYSFADYYVDLHDDGENVWIPFETASELFSNFMLSAGNYNGSEFYFTDSVRSDRNLNAIGYYNNYKKWFSDEKIPADVVKFNYGSICYMVDRYYGFPGRCYFSDAIAQKGFDRAMKETDNCTREVRKALLSENTYTFLAGMRLLNEMMADGGHTCMNYAFFFLEKADGFNSAKMNAEAGRLYAVSGYTPPQDNKNSPIDTRNRILGTGYYFEKGDTAVYCMDDFMPAWDQWKVYYAQGGELPDDCFGNFLRSLNRAKENPAIKNFVIDLSCNTGGSTDVVVAMLSIISGRDRYSVHSSRIGQTITTVFDIDKNADGVFDERDNQVKYDFNFAVLQSNISFSCGNFLPFLANEDGIMLLGEKSGGGSCAIVRNTFGNGCGFIMSYDLKLMDGQGRELDKGIEPDVNLVKYYEGGVPDFSDFYDIELLSEKISNFYGTSPAVSSDPQESSKIESLGTVSEKETQSSVRESSEPEKSTPESESTSQVSIISEDSAPSHVSEDEERNDTATFIIIAGAVTVAAVAAGIIIVVTVRKRKRD